MQDRFASITDEWNDWNVNRQQRKTAEYKILYNRIEQKIITSLGRFESEKQQIIDDKSLYHASVFCSDKIAQKLLVSIDSEEFQKLKPIDLIEIALKYGTIKATMEIEEEHKVFVHFADESSKIAILEAYKDYDLIKVSSVTHMTKYKKIKSCMLKCVPCKFFDEFFSGYVNFHRQWYSNEFPHLAVLKQYENNPDTLCRIWEWYYTCVTKTTLKDFLEKFNLECANALTKNLKYDWFAFANNSGSTLFEKLRDPNNESHAKKYVTLIHLNTKDVPLLDINILQMLVSYGKLIGIRTVNRIHSKWKKIQIWGVQYESEASALSLVKDFRQLNGHPLVSRSPIDCAKGQWWDWSMMLSKLLKRRLDMDQFAELTTLHNHMATGPCSEIYAQIKRPLKQLNCIWGIYWDLLINMRCKRDINVNNVLAMYLERIIEMKVLDHMQIPPTMAKLASEIKKDIVTEVESNLEKYTISDTRTESGLNITPKRGIQSYVIPNFINSSDLASNGGRDSWQDSCQDCTIVITTMLCPLKMNEMIALAISTGLKCGKMKKLKFKLIKRRTVKETEPESTIFIDFTERSAALNMIPQFSKCFNSKFEPVVLTSIEECKTHVRDFQMEAPQSSNGDLDYFEEFLKFFEHWKNYVLYDNPEASPMLLVEHNFHHFVTLIWKAYWDLKFAHSTVKVDDFIQKMFTVSEFIEGNPNSNLVTISQNVQEALHFDQGLTRCPAYCPVSSRLKDKVILMAAKEPMDIPIPMVEKALTCGKVVRIKFHKEGLLFNAATIQMESVESVAKLVVESSDEYVISKSEDTLLPVSFESPLITSKVQEKKYFESMVDFYKCFSKPKSDDFKWPTDWPSFKSSWFIYYQILAGGQHQFFKYVRAIIYFKDKLFLPFTVAVCVAHLLEIYEYIPNETPITNQKRKSTDLEDLEGFVDDNGQSVKKKKKKKKKEKKPLGPNSRNCYMSQSFRDSYTKTVIDCDPNIQKSQNMDDMLGPLPGPSREHQNEADGTSSYLHDPDHSKHFDPSTALTKSPEGSSEATACPIKYLGILCELSDRLGFLGNTMHEVNQEATEISDQGLDPLDVVRVEDNTSLILLVKIRLEKLVDDKSLDMVELFSICTGVEACEKLLEMASP